VSEIEQALAALDEDGLVRLALDATSIASPVGDNAELVRFLDEHMRAQGLRSFVQWFAPPQANVVGTLQGTGGGRSLMINVNAESDFFPFETTVPPARIVDDEWISGWGVWNMKSPLVAAIAAATAVHEAGVELSGDVLVAGVAAMIDQQTVETRIADQPRQGYGLGTKYLLARGAVADMAVCATPTSFKLVRQHLGTTGVRIDVAGPPLFDGTVEDFTGTIHRNRPTSESVAQQLADVVNALNAWIPDYVSRNTVDGVIPYIRFAGIEAGRPWAPVPASDGSLFVYVNTPPDAGLTDVLGEIRSVLDAARASRPYLDASAEAISVNPSVSVAEDHPIVTELQAAHAAVHGEQPEPATVVWHSDASVLAHFGVPSVSYGMPGRYTPGEGEAVRIEDLVACARVFTELIVRVCR
jgi:acetylornithine deacetylase/succinyl-diaminopimelate desuccinylase-like protein